MTDQHIPPTAAELAVWEVTAVERGALIRAKALRLIAEVERLRDRLANNRCNSGHTTLPLALWDCPACVAERIAQRDAEVERLRAVLRWTHRNYCVDRVRPNSHSHECLLHLAEEPDHA